MRIGSYLYDFTVKDTLYTELTAVKLLAENLNAVNNRIGIVSALGIPVIEKIAYI